MAPLKNTASFQKANSLIVCARSAHELNTFQSWHFVQLFNFKETFYRAGVRTTCFISPIFPGITDVEAIIKRVQNQSHLIWLENLNLRGSYKPVIMDYIETNYPDLLPLYQSIYVDGDRSYWKQLDAKLQAFTADIGLDYVTNDDSMNRPFDAPPVVVNFFYHEQIKKSAWGKPAVL